VSVRNGLLALLVEGPKHGFQLKKELEERTGALWQVNVGQVYTTLGRLERDGLVVAEGHTGVGAGGGSDDHRPYRITDVGRTEVDAWFDAPRPRDLPDRDELVVKLTLAVELGRDVVAVIEDQRRTTTEALQRHTRAKARSDEADLARLFALDSAIAQLDAELRWLDLCQARLADRSGARRSAPTRPRGGRR
jgi:DNA-binding PadR family transcriptional regulator